VGRVMATPEARKEAEEMLAIYQRRLRVRNRQIARLGDSADPSIEIERDELLLNIALLEPLTIPEPSAEAKDLVRRHLADDTTLLYIQGAQLNTRMVKVEQQQHASQGWRLAIDDAIKDVRNALAHEKVSRKRGQFLRVSLEVAVLIAALILHAYGWL
jgi:hypothetical protein